MAYVTHRAPSQDLHSPRPSLISLCRLYHYTNPMIIPVSKWGLTPITLIKQITSS